MFETFKQLIEKQVETKSGQTLGYIHDLIINIESHCIDKYIVTSKKLFSSNDLLIDPSDILEITPKKIIVKDTLTTIEETEPVKIKIGQKEVVTVNSEYDR